MTAADAAKKVAAAKKRGDKKKAAKAAVLDDSDSDFEVRLGQVVGGSLRYYRVSCLQQTQIWRCGRRCIADPLGQSLHMMAPEETQKHRPCLVTVFKAVYRSAACVQNHSIVAASHAQLRSRHGVSADGGRRCVVR